MNVRGDQIVFFSPILRFHLHSRAFWHFCSIKKKILILFLTFEWERGREELEKVQWQIEVDKKHFFLEVPTKGKKSSSKNETKLGSAKKIKSFFSSLNNEYNWSHRSIQTSVMSNPEKWKKLEFRCGSQPFVVVDQKYRIKSILRPI